MTMKATPSDINRIARLCESGQENSLRKELDTYPELPKHPRLLLSAIKGSSLGVLKLLFAQGADIAASGNVMLDEAAIASPEALALCVDELRARFESRPEVLYGKGSAMLSQAALHGKVDNLTYLIQEGFCRITPVHLSQPLLDASKKGVTSAVAVLIESGAQPENVHFNAAAVHGHLSVMTLLFDKNNRLTIDRETAKAISNKRESFIGTDSYGKWADIADQFMSTKKHVMAG